MKTVEFPAKPKFIIIEIPVDEIIADKEKVIRDATDVINAKHQAEVTP